ncbi:extensin family protein [Propionibacteriaceae bacterium Y1923]
MTSRRALLLGGAASLLVGCSAQGSSVFPDRLPRDTIPPDGDGCRTPGELARVTHLGAAELVYAETGRGAPVRLEPRFLGQLEAWAEEWTSLSGLGALQQVSNFGGYVDKCHSYHQVGQAFDIAGVVQAGGEVSLRYDQWGPGTAAQLRDYWRLAASAHLHFAYTLTHTFDRAHHNHIHVDNLVSHDGLSRFNPRSGTQLQLLTNACRHVFGLDVPDTQPWDVPLQAAVREVQQRLGLDEPLAEAAGWHGFLRGTARG